MHHLDTMLTSPCCQSVASLRQLQGGTKPERRLSGTSDFAYLPSLNCQRITSTRPWKKSNNRCHAQNSSDTSSEFEDNEAKTLSPQPKRNKGFGSATPKLKNPNTVPSESRDQGVGSERRAREPRAPGVRRRAAPEKPLVLAVVSESDKQIVTVALGLLGVLFVLIFAEGIFLGISGSLSKELDDFAVNSVYPAFTPTVGAFLLVAASYGVFKYLQGGAPSPSGPPQE